MFYLILTLKKKIKSFKKYLLCLLTFSHSPLHNGVEEVRLPATKPSPHPLLDAKWGV